MTAPSTNMLLRTALRGLLASLEGSTGVFKFFVMRALEKLIYFLGKFYFDEVER